MPRPTPIPEDIPDFQEEVKLGPLGGLSRKKPTPTKGGKPVDNRSMKKALLIALAVWMLVSLLVVIAMDPNGGNAAGPAASLPEQRITNTFLDIDGDGDTDLVIKADVVLNDGSVTLWEKQEGQNP